MSRGGFCQCRQIAMGTNLNKLKLKQKNTWSRRLAQVRILRELFEICQVSLLAVIVLCFQLSRLLDLNRFRLDFDLAATGEKLIGVKSVLAQSNLVRVELSK